MRLIEFIILLVLSASESASLNNSIISFENEFVRPRVRRSKFPCGNSFIRCVADDFSRPNIKSFGTLNVDESIPLALEDLSSAHPANFLQELPKTVDANIFTAVVKAAQRDINVMFNVTERQIFNEFLATNFVYSTEAWMELTAMDPNAKAISRSALTLLKIAENLAIATNDDVKAPPSHRPLVSSVSLADVCAKLPIVTECTLGRYRSYSGACNNVRQPAWGSTYQAFDRLLLAVYANGIGSVRQTVNGADLPDARSVARRLMSGDINNLSETVVTILLAQWAQFIYADISQIAGNTLYEDGQQRPIPCCAEKHPECLPIFSDKDDVVLQGCLPYARSFVVPNENCTLGTREQGNMATAFIDGSHIYGKSADEARRLRAFVNGHLRTTPQSRQKVLLPAQTPSSRTCASRRYQSTQRPCFDSASPWTNLLPTGAALHTVIVRQHNRVANNLKNVNPHWDDERLFQEARRVVIAQIQHITYNEFLPLVLGRDQLRAAGLLLRVNSYDSDYDIRTAPNTLNEFAAAAGLFFYAFFPSSIGALDREGRPTQLQRPLSAAFNDPSMLYGAERVDGLLRFMTRRPADTSAPLRLNAEWHDRFLRSANSTGNATRGIDLAALIVQMGRDHGLKPYVDWRRVCRLTVPTGFEDLRDMFADGYDVDELAKVYESIEDVDLYVAALAEKPRKGALVGPTFACIISRQFKKTRQSDRFWYENFFEPSAFSISQLNEIRGTTLAAIICENSDDIGMVQPFVFQLPNEYGNCPLSCNVTAADSIDFRHWIDEEPRPALTITAELLEKAVRLGAEQFRRLQAAESRRIAGQNKRSAGAGAPAFVAHANFLAPKRESIDIARTAGILRETTNVLLKGNGLTATERLPSDLGIATLQRLLPEVDVIRIVGNVSDYLFPETTRPAGECLPRPLPCDHTARYRTFSGWCNNLRFPHYGNAFQPLRRLLDPSYDDGFDTPRTRAKNGRSLPSARRISNAVHSDAPIFHVKFSHMLMQLGQMIDHDITHSPISRGPGNTILNCSRCDSPETLSVHCFPIPIEAGDPHFPATHADGSPRCMPFARSLLGQLTLGYRNQLNQLTSFLDSSNIYGSTDCEANALRLFNRGRLNFTDLGYRREALPQGPQERDCRSIPRHPCFVAGDERNNEQPGLTVLHTILLREHNRIAAGLGKQNPAWSDERLYQETRRIMIAKMQHVVYAEFLPVVLGCERMAREGLTPRRYGYLRGEYRDDCDAGISQEVSTAAFRFGHTLIRATFPRLNASFADYADAVQLAVNFNNASAIYDHSGGHLESILMGLLGTPGMDYDRHIVDAVRNHLFQKPGGPLTGLDLPAVNIQRARDHGMPPYNAYRELCGLGRALDFNDLADAMDTSAVEAIQSVYFHVDDIDLFPGIMSERPLKAELANPPNMHSAKIKPPKLHNVYLHTYPVSSEWLQTFHRAQSEALRALVGPTLSCLLVEQFKRLKHCDRFYYEHDNPSIRFTLAQLTEIRKTTLSKMICDNSEFAGRIQPNALLLPDQLTNSPIKCSELPATDLHEWTDRKFCVVDEQVIELGKTKRVTPCITCTCTSEGTECHSMTILRCTDLFDDYLLSEIKRDTVCLIQCMNSLREKENRYRKDKDFADL